MNDAHKKTSVIRLSTLIAVLLMAGTASGQSCDPATMFDTSGAGDLLGIGFPRGTALGDIDGDGDLDIVASNFLVGSVIGQPGGASVHINNGDGTFEDQVLYPGGTECHGIELGDLDGDNDLDMVVANTGTNDLSIYLNNGDGTYAAEFRVGVGGQPHNLSMADLDGDGDLDLIVPDRFGESILLLFNNGNAVFGNQVSIANHAFPVRARVLPADLDGDGDIDLVTLVVNPNFISVLLNNGDGTFSSPTLYPGESGESIAVHDIDQDGDIDILTSTRVGGVSDMIVTYNNGDGTFMASVVYPGFVNTFSSHALLARDIDGDGAIDLIATSQQGTDIEVRLNDQSNTFYKPGFVFSDGEGDVRYDIEVGDLDNDGDLDLVIPINFVDINAFTGKIRILLNQCGPYAPIITQQPVGVLSSVGGSDVVFAVVAGAYAESYQWRFNGDEIFDDADFSDTDTATLTVVPSEGTQGVYDVVVSNAHTSTASTAVVLGVENLCPADFTGDGLLNFFDISTFLQLFAAGCP